MNIIYLQIIVSFQVLIYFDLLKANRFILPALGYEKWTTKSDIKPWFTITIFNREFQFAFGKLVACYFCTSWWIGLMNAIIYLSWSSDLPGAGLLIMSNTIVSRLLDHLLGYQSFKP